MEKIIIMTETLKSDPIARACGDFQVVRAMSVRELVSALAEEPATLCLIVQAGSYNEQFVGLLRSISVTFPLLEVCVFADDPDQVERVDGYSYLDASMPADRIEVAVAECLESVTSKNQRRYNRFGWPLRAWIRDEAEEWFEYRVHSLSAGGAYLEYAKGVPEPGTIRPMRLEFQNCKMTTDVEILDVRRSSSNLPYGFGIRFTDLASESAAAIDTIVKNALVAKLLNEEEVDEIPAIGETDLTFQFDIS